MFNAADQTHFSLTIDGLDSDFQVLEFTGHESISRTYRFDLELVSENPDIDLTTVLHKQAYLAFHPNGSGIHGQIFSVALGDAGKRLHRYKVSIVPQLAYLDLRVNQRIFQNQTAPQIIAIILQEHGIQGDGYDFQLQTPCPAREYCVQYDESDLQFIQRLCEEEGVHYHFQHSSSGHRLVFGDNQTIFPKIGRPTAYVQDSGMVADEPVIKRFNLRLETRTNSVTRRDYDFEIPSLLMEASYKLQDQNTVAPTLEDYDYPGRFTDLSRGKQLSQRALERHRADYQLAEGKGDEPRLVTGHFMEMSDHPRIEWNSLWLLTDIFHEGKQPQVLEESVTSDTTHNKDDFHHGYRNTFQAIPWDVFYRPPLEHPKPCVLGSQSAIVTGPKGEEIHCDAYGRIKVQFHWDRDGQADESSSCWLRVASGWAGGQYGGVAIPRIGMEVLVTFLEGDPDQPLVSGCLYHKENVVPYPLPANKTRTLFKTLSSPGGAGYNELRIEDKAGQEQIYVHAQRNWDENIENDQLVRVGNERHDTVEANSYSEFQAEEHRTTVGDRKSYITLDDHLSVGQTQHVKLGASMLVDAGSEIHIKAGSKVVIDAGMELTLQAAGSFVKLDASGVTMVGPLVQANVGGSAGNGSGIAIKLPQLPREVDADQVGHLMEEALVNAPLEKVKTQPIRMLNFSG